MYVREMNDDIFDVNERTYVYISTWVSVWVYARVCVYVYVYIKETEYEKRLIVGTHISRYSVEGVDRALYFRLLL